MITFQDMAMVPPKSFSNSPYTMRILFIYLLLFWTINLISAQGTLQNTELSFKNIQNKCLSIEKAFFLDKGLEKDSTYHSFVAELSQNKILLNTLSLTIDSTTWQLNIPQQLFDINTIGHLNFAKILMDSAYENQNDSMLLFHISHGVHLNMEVHLNQKCCLKENAVFWLKAKQLHLLFLEKALKEEIDSIENEIKSNNDLIRQQINLKSKYKLSLDSCSKTIKQKYKQFEPEIFELKNLDESIDSLIILFKTNGRLDDSIQTNLGKLTAEKSKKEKIIQSTAEGGLCYDLYKVYQFQLKNFRNLEVQIGILDQANQTMLMKLNPIKMDWLHCKEELKKLVQLFQENKPSNN